LSRRKQMAASITACPAVRIASTLSRFIPPSYPTSLAKRQHFELVRGRSKGMACGLADGTRPR
jgi:hypothetical protein